MEEKQKHAQEKTLLEWSVHLFTREKRYRSIIAIAGVLSTIVAGYVFTQNTLITCIYGAILFFALGEFFFPVKYRITDQGVYSLAFTGPRFMSWERVKKCYKNDQGVKLSIFEKPSPMESFRGLFIRFGDRRDEIIPLVRKMHEQQAAGTP